MTTFDSHRNFAKGTLTNSPGTAGASFVLSSGEGANFAANMPVTIVPANTQPDGSNAEIGYVTGVSTDTLTVTRAQQDTTAKNAVAGWQVLGTITAKALTDIETDVAAKADASHTHTASQVTDFDTEVSNNTDVAANTTARHTHSNSAVLNATTASFTTADETKLDGIATGATANSSDATLLARANHTGTQLASTISDLSKSSVGLANVDNTSDLNKPISTATQTTLDLKQPKVQGFIGHHERDVPNFTRYASNPVFTQANQNPASGAATAASLYWPAIVKTDVIASPLDAYYMYYSTDHGAGGIYLASAPTVYGPWTGRGLVYNDTTSGSSTETPAVIWNEDESLYFLYYHNIGVSGAIGSQTTCLATSPDGITWTRVGIAIDPYGSSAYPGDGHTGYFHPFRIGKRWYGYHLLGGTDKPRFGISYSSDGRTWMIDSRILSYGSDQNTDGRRIEWNTGSVVSWRGQMWWIGTNSNFTSGSTAKDARIVAYPLGNDLRHTLGSPYIQLYPTVGANESTDYRATYCFVEDDQLILYYQCGNNFNVAVS